MLRYETLGILRREKGIGYAKEDQEVQESHESDAQPLGRGLNLMGFEGPVAMKNSGLLLKAELFDVYGMQSSVVLELIGHRPQDQSHVFILQV